MGQESSSSASPKVMGSSSEPDPRSRKTSPPIVQNITSASLPPVRSTTSASPSIYHSALTTPFSRRATCHVTSPTQSSSILAPISPKIKKEVQTYDLISDDEEPAPATPSTRTRTPKCAALHPPSPSKTHTLAGSASTSEPNRSVASMLQNLQRARSQTEFQPPESVAPSPAIRSATRPSKVEGAESSLFITPTRTCRRSSQLPSDIREGSSGQPKYSNRSSESLAARQSIFGLPTPEPSQQTPSQKEHSILLSIETQQQNHLNAPQISISTPVPSEPQGPQRLKRRNIEWIEEFKKRNRAKTPPKQHATRSQPRYPRPPKPPRPKKPLCLPRRKAPTKFKDFKERDIYEGFDFETRYMSGKCGTETLELENKGKNGAWSDFGGGFEDEMCVKESFEFSRTSQSFEQLFFSMFDTASEKDTAKGEDKKKKEATFSVPASLLSDGAVKMDEGITFEREIESTSQIIRHTAWSPMKEKPSFLKPLLETIQVALGPNVFTIYRDFLCYYAPVLAKACYFATSIPATPDLLLDIDLDVFGLFVQWIYTQQLCNKHGKPAFQHRLMGLWVLAKRLQMPQLQNDTIDMLEARRQMDHGMIQTKSIMYVYANSIRGDMMRQYLVHVCLPRMESFGKEVIEERFPKEMQDEIEEAKLFKLEDFEDKLEEQIDTSRYHANEEYNTSPPPPERRREDYGGKQLGNTGII